MALTRVLSGFDQALVCYTTTILVLYLYQYYYNLEKKGEKTEKATNKKELLA
jgi:hypothetical protein